MITHFMNQFHPSWVLLPVVISVSDIAPLGARLLQNVRILRYQQSTPPPRDFSRILQSKSFHEARTFYYKSMGVSVDC